MTSNCSEKKSRFQEHFHEKNFGVTSKPMPIAENSGIVLPSSPASSSSDHQLDDSHNGKDLKTEKNLPTTTNDNNTVIIPPSNPSVQSLPTRSRAKSSLAKNTVLRETFFPSPSPLSAVKPSQPITNYSLKRRNHIRREKKKNSSPLLKRSLLAASRKNPSKKSLLQKNTGSNSNSSNSSSSTINSK